jgi:hypothetical protein
MSGVESFRALSFGAFVNVWESSRSDSLGVLSISELFCFATSATFVLEAFAKLVFQGVLRSLVEVFDYHTVRKYKFGSLIILNLIVSGGLNSGQVL